MESTKRKRVLTGIQPSGKLHIGNYFGTIKRMIEYQECSDLFLFVANLHCLTSLSDPKAIRELTLNAAMDMLSLGIDPERTYFWAQSDVPEVTELMWILSTLTPFGLMERAHSYKDKTAKGIQASLGLFSYPVLMAADILIYQADVVPVGKDQKQHLEITRDIALKFNHQYGDVLTIPEPDISEGVAVIPGTDGQKMSKSYNNTIPIFADEKGWKKTVMSIVTDSKSVEDAKDPDACNVCQLYKLFATPEEQKALAKRYRQGGLGYGDAKKMLLEKVIATFEPYAKKRARYQAHPEEVKTILKKGAEKVRPIAQKTLEKVRKLVGIEY